MNLSGMVLLEILLSLSVFVLFMVAMTGVLIYGRESASTSGARARAVLLAEEGIEAVKNMRDNSMSNLVDGTHGLSLVGGEWQLSGSADAVDEFTREIEISNVSGLRHVTARVTWSQNAQRTGDVELTSMLSNWRVPLGDWSNPLNTGISVVLPGGHAGRKLKVAGETAFVVSAGNSKDFVAISLEDIWNIYVLGRLNLANKSYDLVVGDGEGGDDDEYYVYVAAGTNNKELMAVEIEEEDDDDFEMELEETLNLPGNSDAVAIYKQGDYVYMARESGGTEFYIVEIEDDGDDLDRKGGCDISGMAQDVVVEGDYAYIASHYDSKELQVVDVSNKNDPLVIFSEDLPGNANGMTVLVVDGTLVLGRDNGDVFFYDLTNPESPLRYPVGYNAGGDVMDLAYSVSDRYLFLATHNEDAEFQMLDISDPNAPVLASALNLNNPLNGVTYDPVADRVFAVGEVSEEHPGAFVVIMPG